MEILPVLVIGSVICGCAGVAIGQERGRPNLGGALGLLGGPLGLVLIALWPRSLEAEAHWRIRLEAEIERQKSPRASVQRSAEEAEFRRWREQQQRSEAG